MPRPQWQKLPLLGVLMKGYYLFGPALAKSWQRRIIDRDPVIRDGRKAGTGAATGRGGKLKQTFHIVGALGQYYSA